ncbi:MAG: hypothetical protein H0X25_02175 [Acidobacteriales bacterium]|nr:hypothetical protein [Terriglobales bacterium]
MLRLTNAARAQAGAPPLTLDADLSRAAAAHAELMAEHRQLSHQFPAEPELLERLGSQANSPLDSVAENVAVAADARRAHDALMHSPPHKKNLLNRCTTRWGWRWRSAARCCTSWRISPTSRRIPLPRRPRVPSATRSNN